MGKKSRKRTREMDFDAYDEWGGAYDDDFDVNELANDIYSTEWRNGYESEERFTARRKIERRRDMKKLYSQLDDWEEFGSKTDW